MYKFKTRSYTSYNNNVDITGICDSI